MAMIASSATQPTAAMSPAVRYAAQEFSRFSNTTQLVFTGPTTVNVTLQNKPPQDSSTTPAKKANPWAMMAILTLLKLPFSFLTASWANKLLFDITMSHSIKKEMIGIGAEVLGTIGLKVFADHVGPNSQTKCSHPENNHEKQLEIASGVVSFIGTSISTFGCIKDSKKLGVWGPLSRLGKGWRIVASLTVGTLCGVVEGLFTAKLEPWLERKLSKS